LDSFSATEILLSKTLNGSKTGSFREGQGRRQRQNKRSLPDISMEKNDRDIGKEVVFRKQNCV
jgi:hypothetical protein